MSTYHEMTDDEVRDAVRAICNRCGGLVGTDQVANTEVERLIHQELGYNGTTAVTSTSTSLGGMTMRMFMVMLHGPSGETISV